MQLKELRELSRLTQQELAERANCARSTIASIEVGFMSPSIPLAKRLAEVLEVDWTIFFEEE